MKALANARKLSRLFDSPILLNSDRVLARRVRLAEASVLLQCRRKTGLFSLFQSSFSGNSLEVGQFSASLKTISRANFSSKATDIEEGNPTEAVKEIYDKIIESVVVKRTMSPNAWLWSMIEKCQNNDDIKLLFDVLENLRRFRLSNLRISSNFNLNLCQEITKACIRVGALDLGKNTLCKHNVYGLTPTIASANVLLRYAKEHNDAKLMVEIMKLVKKNDLPLQPSTADLVFSICYDADDWALLTKYSKKFVLAGVKLRKTAFDIWTEFASKIGDAKALSIIEKLRPDLIKDQALAS